MVDSNTGLFSRIFSSIRFKFVVITAISIFSCAFFVFKIAIDEHKNSYVNSISDNLVALTENLSDDLLLMLSDDADSFTLRNELLKFTKYKNVFAVIIFDKNGEILEQYFNPVVLKSGNSPKIQPLSINDISYDVTADGSYINCLKPIGEYSSPIGYVLVKHNFTEPVSQVVTDFLNKALPLVLLVLIVSILITYFTFKHIFVPIINLAKFAREVEKTRNYKLKINVRGNDEISKVCQGVNLMLKTIDKETTLNYQQNQLLQEQKDFMYHLANYDQLTKLPNRRHILDLLEAELRYAKEVELDFPILFFDVDGFKSINDRMGHDIGDLLLIEVTKIVQKHLKDDDVLARLAGDEFLIFSPNMDRSKTIDLADKIMAEFQHEITIQKWQIYTGISIGIAFSKESDYQLGKMVSNSDIAMYESKMAGKNRYTIFQDEMLVKHRRRVQIVNLIPLAISNNEFYILYQPKVSNTGEVSGLEALIRWEHSELGFVSPAEFIPIAENSGKVGEITKWVIQKVISDLQEIKATLGDDVQVSLNVSSNDLKHEWLENYIYQKLNDYHEDLKNIQFEITESSYLGDINLANNFFSNIRKNGGTIALDDFGTGFSSLSYLTQIEIDTLKIDRQFVHNSLNEGKDLVILQSILTLSKNLNLTTCCEGIETKEQAIYLLDHGCDHMQGFYFAKPSTAANLAAVKLEVLAKFRLFTHLRHPSS